MASNATIPRKGDHVSFHVRDIYLPGPAEFAESLDPNTEVLGRVVDFSDSGASPGTFAIVQTDESKKVVVPVNSLSPIQRGSAATKKRRLTPLPRGRRSA
jgi:hypothetical protein